MSRPTTPFLTAMTNIVITRHSCVLDLTNEQWERLTLLDQHYLDDAKLFSKAFDLGVVNGSIEYSGHYGRAIYFDVDAESDLEAIEFAIVWAIEHTVIE